MTSGDVESAAQLIDLQQAAYEKAVSSLQKWTDYNIKGTQKDADKSAAANTTGKSLAIGLTLTAATLAITFAVLFSNYFIRTILAISSVVEKAANGDLRELVVIKTKDELGQFADAFNQMIVKLRDLIGDISLASQNVAAAAEEISATTEEIAGGNAIQASEAQNITDMFQYLRRASDSVVASADRAADMSRKTHQGAEEGERMIQASTRSMGQLSQQMSLLEKDSNKIGEIIGVINDIADQTNLLALNAAIEAARAGEQGRGFAVVADEVRKLAERSGDATKEIASIIQGMQNNTRDSVKAVEAAAGLSNKTGQAFVQIIRMVNETAEQVESITVESQVSPINRSM
ncbi:methyl-accepting chemotaxis protein [Paenibacillus cremeus]|uniref:Methyl-accepting chemotaxis protein n=2 Tax=Paenibacillus cremeus TaxID=2163881 RepID=A0A559KD47_9BACL|nr:methyl-accepting chemotaxis protein [Paenibacillus cremeus]